MKELLNANFLDKLILGSLALLMFVLSINGTMALRNFLAIILLFSLLYKTFKQKIDLRGVLKNKQFNPIFITLLLFVLYVFLHSIFISHEPSWSFSEFRSQLIYPLLYFFMGILLVLNFNNDKKLPIQTILSIIFFAMFAHVIYIDTVALYVFFTEGIVLHRYGGLMDTPVGANYVTNILLAMMMAEIIYRLRTDESVLMMGNKTLYWLLGLTVVATLVETIRLGDITLVFLGFISGVVFLYKNEKYSFKFKVLIPVSMFFVLTLPLIYNMYTDPRWIRLTETIPVAIDTSASNMHWRDPSLFPAPRVKSGSLAGNSNYMRIAWARQSAHYIRKTPLGIGFGRDAFGHTIEQYHPLRRDEKGYRGMHSHSGIIDLALGVGIPGVLLWSFFGYTVSRKSLKEVKESFNYYAILSVFLIMGFYGRSLFDSNMRDHMFLQFMLLLGVVLIYMFSNKENNSA